MKEQVDFTKGRILAPLLRFAMPGLNCYERSVQGLILID